MLKLLVDGSGKTYAQLSQELGMSASEIHAAVRRSAEAGLIEPVTRAPLRKPLEEYLLHGVRYAFPAKRGSLARGIRRHMRHLRFQPRLAWMICLRFGLIQKVRPKATPSSLFIVPCPRQ